MFNKPLFYAGVAAVFAYNILSIGFAYRAGQNAVRREQMEILAQGLNDAIHKYSEQLTAYQSLAVQFSENHARTQAQLRQTERNIDAYLKTIDRERPCIDDTGIGLLNQTLRPAPLARDAAPARGSERARPLPAPRRNP